VQISVKTEDKRIPTFRRKSDALRADVGRCFGTLTDLCCPTGLLSFLPAAGFEEEEEEAILCRGALDGLFEPEAPLEEFAT